MLYVHEAYAYLMRRLLLVFTILTCFVAAPSAQAQQRDPFDPVIDADQGGGIPNGPAEEAPEVLPAPDPNEPLPDTGDSSSSAYLGIAYLLIAMGAMVLMLGKVGSPSPKR
jgi:LPXTG-motif cell wall-anchored protein